MFSFTKPSKNEELKQNANGKFFEIIEQANSDVRYIFIVNLYCRVFHNAVKTLINEPVLFVTSQSDFYIFLYTPLFLYISHYFENAETRLGVLNLQFSWKCSLYLY